MIAIRTRTVAALATAALVLVPALSACGQAAEKAAEVAMENAMSGADVNIEDDGVTITDNEGNQMAAGENIQLPDNWPAEIPPFEGGTLTVVTVSPDGVWASWTASGSAQEAADAYGATLEAAGYTLDTESKVDAAVFRSYKGNGYLLNISTADDSGETVVLVTGGPDTSGSDDMGSETSTDSES
jgi:hypothetical protein